jgi:2-polyprenyl-3-methyl-5-hydroxy-6-metoxy-1,4-benzoquinol methylase
LTVQKSSGNLLIRQGTDICLPAAFREEKMGMKLDRKRWDERFKGKEFAFGREPNPFLKKQVRLLPKGKALDIAAGEGRNSVFLAGQGFDVDAVDISEEGLKKAQKFAAETGVKIHTMTVDLDSCRIEREKYDLIANFYFLKRSLTPHIKKGLKKGGRVIFETYILEHRNLGVGGPKQVRYFLRPNELLRMFKNFHILYYREGIFKEGGRRKAVASLIAEKR